MLLNQKNGTRFVLVTQNLATLELLLPTYPLISTGHLTKRFHLRVRIMDNFGQNGGVPWLDGKGVEDNFHFLIDCFFLRETF